MARPEYNQNMYNQMIDQMQNMQAMYGEGGQQQQAYHQGDPMRAKSPGHELDGSNHADYQSYPQIHHPYPNQQQQQQPMYNNYTNGYDQDPSGSQNYAHQYPLGQQDGAPVTESAYGYSAGAGGVAPNQMGYSPATAGYDPYGGGGGVRAGSLPRGAGSGSAHSRKESTRCVKIY